MSLHRDIIEERADYTFQTEPIYVNVANSTWLTTDDADDIFGTEILDTRVLASTVTTVYNTTTNALDFTVEATITTPLNVSLTFNRVIVIRDGLTQVNWTGTEGGTTFTVGNPNMFVTGDRIWYNGTLYTLDNSVGQVITVNSGPFTAGTNVVVDATGLLTVAAVLSGADTTFISANSSITLTVTGSTLTGV